MKKSELNLVQNCCIYHGLNAVYYIQNIIVFSSVQGSSYMDIHVDIHVVPHPHPPPFPPTTHTYLFFLLSVHVSFLVLLVFLLLAVPPLKSANITTINLAVPCSPEYISFYRSHMLYHPLAPRHLQPRWGNI